MLTLGITLIVIAVVLALLGVFVQSVSVLLWVGIALLVVGAIIALIDRTRSRGGPVV